jgi:hypothetical protein
MHAVSEVFCGVVVVVLKSSVVEIDIEGEIHC